MYPKPISQKLLFIHLKHFEINRWSSYNHYVRNGIWFTSSHPWFLGCGNFNVADWVPGFRWLITYVFQRRNNRRCGLRFRHCERFCIGLVWKDHRRQWTMYFARWVYILHCRDIDQQIHWKCFHRNLYLHLWMHAIPNRLTENGSCATLGCRRHIVIANLQKVAT